MRTIGIPAPGMMMLIRQFHMLDHHPLTLRSLENEAEQLEKLNYELIIRFE